MQNGHILARTCAPRSNAQKGGGLVACLPEHAHGHLDGNAGPDVPVTALRFGHELGFRSVTKDSFRVRMEGGSVRGNRDIGVANYSRTHGMAVARLPKSSKVAIFSCAPYDREWFDWTNQELGLKIDFQYHEEQLSIDTVHLAKGCGAVCMFVNDVASADVIKALGAEGVKLFALRCAGFDRVDLQAAQDAGITVARVPAYSPYAVGEHDVALMLSLNRRIPNAYRNSRIGNFKLDGQLGCSTQGKRVGIIGTGLIGTIAATVLKKGFECDAVAYDAFPNAKIQRLGIPYLELDALLSSCDFISLHALMLPSTAHMINEERLKIMKKGIMIVNTSRGGLIGTEALIKGLKDGTIGGAAMDVVEGEGPYFFKDFSTSCIKDDIIATLVRMPNVILTPHSAFFTKEALKTIVDTTLKSIQGVREGSGPPKQNGVLRLPWMDRISRSHCCLLWRTPTQGPLSAPFSP